MPIEIVEKIGSPEVTEGPSQSATLRYYIHGAPNIAAAITAILSALPAVVATAWGDLVFASLDTKPHGDTGPPPDEVYLAVAKYNTYKPKEPPKVGDSEYTFDTTGTTEHITHSISTEQRQARPGETAPDFKGAIGVSEDDVAGCDIIRPAYAFSETHYLDDTTVTAAYKAALFAATAKTNASTFKGFAAQEVLFMGARGSKRGQEDWQVAFSFQAKENKTSLTIGEITGINKKGWHYIWFRYRDEEDAAADMIVKRAIAAYVEKVYDTADFSTLGIGTT